MKNLKLLLKFPSETADKPISYTLVKEYDLMFNILHAEIRPGKIGRLTVDFCGKEENLEKGLRFLESKGIEYNILTHPIIRDEEKCVDCGLCTGICPSGALKIDPETLALTFCKEKCLVCKLCVKTCPVNAIEVHEYEA